MGLFKEIFCVNCGKKTGMLSRIKLNDGNYLCGDCSKKVHSDIPLHEYSYEDYLEVLDYLEYSNTVLKEKFDRLYFYHDLHLDPKNGIFYYNDLGFTKPLYLELKNVREFDLIFEAEELKEGFFGDKVKGNVTLHLVMDKPYLTIHKVIATGVKAKARTKQGFLSTKVEYDYPQDLQELMNAFYDSWQATSEMN